jgi:hypothetical protein
MQAADGTFMVMLATIFVMFERVRLAAVVGSVGVFILVRCG